MTFCKERAPQSMPYTKNCWQLRNIGNKRSSLLQEREYQLVIQYQISPENMHTSNPIQTEQDVLMYLGLYMHMHLYS